MNIRTEIQNEQRLIEIAAMSERPKLHKKAVDKRKFWTQVITGENQDEHVLKFRPNETEQQKQVRLNAYNPLTPQMVEKVRTIYQEADRSNKVEDKIEIESDENGEKLKKYKDMSKVYKDLGPRGYVNSKFINLALQDQNAFEVIDYKVNSDSIVSEVYCKTYTADNVIDFLYYNGHLQYLIVTDKIEIEAENYYQPKKEYEKFILYGVDHKFTAVEVTDENKDKLQSTETFIDGQVITKSYFVDVEIKKDSQKTKLYIEYFKTFSKRVPAYSYGFVDCLEEDKLHESVLRPAKHIFIDNIQKKANFDSILKAHGIYRTFARVPKCTFKDKRTGLSCRNGKMQNGTTCPACEGTGKTKLHDTDLDIITFPLQDDVEPRERVNLQDMVYTHEINTNLILLYEAQVDKTEKQVSLAIFNTNIFDRKELLAGTATEIRAQFKSVNNKLYKYEYAKSKMVKFIAEQIAIYLDIDDFKFQTDIPSDFDLETLDDLLVILHKAKESGAPQHFINDIQMKIVKMQHEDKPEVVAEIEAFEKFKPFSDVSENERMAIITLLEPNDPVRVKYMYFSEICKKIRYSDVLEYTEEGSENVKKINKKFHELPYKEQEKIFDYYTSLFFNDEEEGDGDEDVIEVEVDEE